jgi:hypothetical protein
MDIGTLNREKKFRCILVIWGKFYEVYRDGRQISNRQEEVNKRGGLKIK